MIKKMKTGLTTFIFYKEKNVLIMEFNTTPDEGTSGVLKFRKLQPSQRKINIQDQHLDIQLCDKHLIYSIEISKIFICNIRDIHINLH